MTLSLAGVRRVLRRELIALYAVVILADVIVGLVLPLFPLLATRVGASVSMIGMLTAINAGVQVASGVPLGMLADRYGRGLVICFGLTLFVLMSAILAWAPSPMWLIPAQVMLGVGIVSVFVMGGALAGNLAAPSERGTVMGLYSTSMGVGFTLGPLVGGVFAQQVGPAGSLLLAGGIAFCGLIVALLFLPRHAPAAPNTPSQRLGVEWNRALVFAALANFLFNPIFGAIVTTFAALQAAALGMNTVAIGSLFATRSLISTSLRLPTGLISTPRMSRVLMLLALALGGFGVLGMAAAQTYSQFLGALILEGVSYGVFLTAGQAFVAHHSAPERLGASLGAYTMAGGISASLSPFLLGSVAEHRGLPAVFWFVGVLALASAVALALLQRYARR